MKKNNVLNSEIKEMYGHVLGIGDIDIKIVEKLNRSKKITELNVLSNKEYIIDNEEGNSKIKKMQIKYLRKFKKKRINFLICDYDKIDRYLNTFIKDSIFITNNYIYFCTNDVKKIKRKYERYDVSIEEIKCSDTSILKINTSKAVNNKLKELVYSIFDFSIVIVELITDLLLS